LAEVEKPGTSSSKWLCVLFAVKDLTQRPHRVSVPSVLCICGPQSARRKKFPGSGGEPFGLPLRLAGKSREGKALPYPESYPDPAEREKDLLRLSRRKV
jgi:hypothetical protein